VLCEYSAERRSKIETPTGIGLRTLNDVARCDTLPAMDSLRHPLAFVLLLVSGWVNRQQQALIDYLPEENRILRAAHGSRPVRLTDEQRRRLAVKGVVLGRRRLAEVSGIVTPDAILRWYRRLVAQKYDRSHARRLCRRSTKPDIAALVVRLANETPTWGYTRIPEI